MVDRGLWNLREHVRDVLRQHVVDMENAGVPTRKTWFGMNAAADPDDEDTWEQVDLAIRDYLLMLTGALVRFRVHTTTSGAEWTLHITTDITVQ